jgi:hypothetical protein
MFQRIRLTAAALVAALALQSFSRPAAAHGGTPNVVVVPANQPIP